MGRSRFSKRSSILPVAEWPAVDVECFVGEDKILVANRIQAIRMYLAGLPHTQIAADSGIIRSEVHRLLKRCCEVAADGRIWGFRALAPNMHIKNYERTAPVVCVPGEANNGSTGALGQLFERYPMLQKLVHELYLPREPKNKFHDVRMRICDLHNKFIRWLEEHGLQPNEWPLSTKTEGLEALRAYCNSLSSPYPEQWVRARAGEQAAARLTVGRGIEPIVPTMRPFNAVQLDFHKVDSASMISITSPFGVEIKVPLPRWYVGAIVEERYDLIIGAVLALEINPSADSVLETIESAIIPLVAGSKSCALAIGLGNKVFPNQMFEQLAGQGFSILRMDNGWSNVAFDVIDNVVDTIGCAVHLGPVKAWWGRDTIERVFGQTTRSGLQRSPCTYGSGPLDSRKNNPEQNAVAFELKLSDITSALEHQILLQNCSPTGALMMGSPMDALAAAIDNYGSTFIPSPLPATTQELPLLMYHTDIVTVRGNRKKGERPYVKVGPWRYTNEIISSDFALIGQHLKIYSSLRDARIAYAVCVETGEVLGKLLPPNRWQEVEISWSVRSILNREGTNHRRKVRREMHSDDWAGTLATATAIEDTNGMNKANVRKAALAVAKAAAKQAPLNHPSEHESDGTPSVRRDREAAQSGSSMQSLFLDVPFNIKSLHQPE
ncbi:helix-turn-helix domain-containing protein [Duganella vulcania]|uniref:Integrase catalytic domain-containing protein n=1 Tax=Duganella vulcania TaxID=2692166 RepID=A0A845GUJ2_9BURK|nr:helix-turn-helix domain-containing protein [Duganella vulcania]MYM96199.1 hypothetical protein [Duganella vulcania]